MLYELDCLLIFVILGMFYENFNLKTKKVKKEVKIESEDD